LHKIKHGKRGNSTPNNIKVYAFLINGTWDIEKIIKIVPSDLVATILATQIHYQPMVSDQPIWKPNANGEFTCLSAWDQIREKRNQSFCCHNLSTIYAAINQERHIV